MDKPNMLQTNHTQEEYSKIINDFLVLKNTNSTTVDFSNNTEVAYTFLEKPFE